MTDHWINWFKNAIFYTGLPLVSLYHLVCSNIFLSTAAYDAQGLEYFGNVLLAPTHYLLGGRIAYPSQEGPYTYLFEQRFNYNEAEPLLWAKTGAALVALPFTLGSGVIVKGLSFSSAETRERHAQLTAADNSTAYVSNRPHYEALGLPVAHYKNASKAEQQNYPRRPGDENHLAEEKEALRVIANILMDAEIPFWLDCGSCLGAWRYQGVIPWDYDIDIAILTPDFDNVRHLLQQLDKSKYEVQDWSSRDKPKTYLKVYVKATHSIIDIYHYAVDAENGTLNYVLSNEDNIFLTEGWRARERRYKTPVPISYIFPLTMGYFDGITIPLPHQPEQFLKLRYGDNIAPARIYDATTGLYEKDPSHPYWQRSHVY